MPVLISFFSNFSKKKIGFYKLSFRFFNFNSIPHIRIFISSFSTQIPRIPTQIPRIPTLIPRIPTSFPAFPAFPPRFPAFPSPFLHSHSHSLHYPHSVPRFPIPAFTDSQISCTSTYWLITITLSLQGFDFKLAHIKGEFNISDYPKPLSSVLEDYVNYTISYAFPNVITLADIKTETLNDKTLQMITYVAELKKFRIIEESLTLNEEQNIILKSHRTVLPRMLRKVTLQLAHVGHQRIEKTKGLLRSKVYFLELDKLIEELVQNCIPCQRVTKPKTKPPPPKSTITEKRLLFILIIWVHFQKAHIY